MRKILALKDEFYNRYIIKGNLFAPVIDAFIRNNGRYNLLDSAILEMFEFIKLVRINLSTKLLSQTKKTSPSATTSTSVRCGCLPLLGIGHIDMFIAGGLTEMYTQRYVDAELR